MRGFYEEHLQAGRPHRGRNRGPRARRERSGDTEAGGDTDDLAGVCRDQPLAGGHRSAAGQDHDLRPHKLVSEREAGGGHGDRNDVRRGPRPRPRQHPATARGRRGRGQSRQPPHRRVRTRSAPGRLDPAPLRRRPDDRIAGLRRSDYGCRSRPREREARDLPRPRGRASGHDGAQLRNAKFKVNGPIIPTAGAARWIAFTTPYTPATGQPNVAGTVETRSFVGPGAVTLTTKVTSKKKKQVTLSGLVTQSGLAAVAKVSLLINGKAKASATSNAAGRYSKKVKGTGKRSTFQATVTAAARDLGAEGCANPTQPPIPCVSATAGGFTATSKKITVRF